MRRTYHERRTCDATCILPAPSSIRPCPRATIETEGSGLALLPLLRLVMVVFDWRLTANYPDKSTR